MKPDKIAFRLDTPEAVEYANGHRENKKEYYVDDSDGFYFHVPSSHRSAFGHLHILDHIAPGYTDVTKDFKETYWRPWKDKLASVQNREVNVVATLGSGSGNTDEQVEELKAEVRRLSWLVAHYGVEKWAEGQDYEYDDYAGANGGWVKRGIPFQTPLQWTDLRDMFIKAEKLTID
jgi:hypothetical protein